MQRNSFGPFQQSNRVNARQKIEQPGVFEFFTRQVFQAVSVTVQKRHAPASPRSHTKSPATSCDPTDAASERVAQTSDKE